MSEVRDDAGERRYELDTPAGVAFAAYADDGAVRTFTHTVVPRAAEGQGVGSRLIAGALADVRARGLRIVPQCAFVRAWLQRHPDDGDLLADGAGG